MYAGGVVASLLPGGHLSDSIGRRRVFLPALLVDAVGAIVFVVDPSLAGLILARIMSGTSAGRRHQSSDYTVTGVPIPARAWR